MRNFGIIEKEGYKIFVTLGDDVDDNLLNAPKYRPYRSQIFGFAKPNSSIVYTDINYNTEYVFGIDRDVRDELLENGYELVYVTDFIGNKIKDIVEKELEAYIVENQNNSEFIFEAMKNSDKMWLDRVISEYHRYEDFKYEHVGTFVVKKDYTTRNHITGGIKDLSFDFKTMTFNLSDKEIFERAISTAGKYVPLLKRQIELGTAPTVAAKRVELIKFFQDKKSINVVLKNGMTIRDDLTWNNKIYINDKNEVCYHMSYYARPRYNNLRMADIDYFKYQNKIFKINSEEFIIKLDK